MARQIAFDDSDKSQIELWLHRERMGDDEFARLLRDIDELSAWFRGERVASYPQAIAH